MLEFEKMTPMIQKAYKMAKEAHEGQLDKAGNDYILHPMTVASNVGNSEYAIVVGLLHDVCEDTDVTLEEIEKEFPIEVYEAVKCMTHEKDVPYMDYIRALKDNEIAKKVKLSDLKHNMDLSRIKNVTQRDLDRLEYKYKPALAFLLEENADC